MHILSETNTDRNGAITKIWDQYRHGLISFDQLQAAQDTALIQQGDVCEACRVRPVKALSAGRRLCRPCAIRERGARA